MNLYEVEECELVGQLGTRVDVTPVLQDLDLINAVWLACPDQVEQVADGIDRAFRTYLSRVGIQAMLHLLFD